MLTQIELSNLSPEADRAIGSVVGALIGDAAGGIFEFMGRPPTINEARAALDLPGGGVFDLAPGQFTDDGEMTMALLGAIVHIPANVTADSGDRDRWRCCAL
jgi:ADP-ribosylglycohydrolase